MILALAVGLLAPVSSGATAGPPPGSSPADFVMWLRCGDLIAMTNADLDRWKSRGVDGFTCNVQWLKGMGGNQDFTGDPTVSLAPSNYSVQRQLRDTNIAGRAASRGMKLYLGGYLSNYNNLTTPLRDWFDDAGWSTVVVPKFRDFAGAAKLLGFAGITLDGEMYSGSTARATWEWAYQGNLRTEAEVRAKVKARGTELMSAIVAGFPNLTILDYHALLPETWADYADPKNYASLVHLDFWDGMTSVESYGEIDFLEAAFYKSPQMSGVSWDSALTYDLNSFYSMLSRRLTHWAYASQHVGRVPFAWISAGTETGEAAGTPAQVSSQLQAFRRWSSTNLLVNYMGGSSTSFDYGPYVSAMQAASTSGVVDTRVPAVSINPPSLPTSASVRTMAGTASDDFAIRSVSWRNDRLGTSGAAAMTWTIVSGDGKGTPWTWRMDWTATIPGLAVGVNPITVTATDIHGLTSTAQVSLSVMSGSAVPDTYLSALSPTASVNGYGPYERNLSNGGLLPGDGTGLRLNGVSFAKGLGTAASADISYSLARSYRTFAVAVGVDDECAAAGSVAFQVYVDGAKVADTGPMTGTSATRTITLDVTGRSSLRLVAGDAGDGRACDHADWADARLFGS